MVTRTIGLLRPILLFVIIHGVLLRNTTRIALPDENASFEAPHRVDVDNVEASNVKNVKSTPSLNNKVLLMKPIRSDNESMSVEETMDYKAVLWSFPGSGEEELLYVLERLDRGTTNSSLTVIPLALGFKGVSGLLFPSHHGRRSKSNSMIPKHSNTTFHSVPKCILLVRDIFDVIWTRYQRSQTGSPTRAIARRDFHPAHFALQAVEWAKEYTHVVEETFIPCLLNHTSFVIKYEAMNLDPRREMLHLLKFVGEEISVIDAETPISSLHKQLRHPSEYEFDHVDKSEAYESYPLLVQNIWGVAGDVAQLFGYTKPTTSNHSDELGSTPMPLGKALPRNRYLTYVPTGGGLSDQILELQIALHLARESGRRLLLPSFLTDGHTVPDRYGCCEVKGGRSCRVGDLTKPKAISWSQIIDTGDLSDRFGAPYGASQNIPARFSELTLSEFNRCNTQWVFRAREECQSDFVFTGSVAIHRLGQVARSTHCLFDATREVNVLRLVDLISTVPMDFVPEKILYAPSIRNAATKFSTPIHRIAGGGALYACAQLKSHLPNESPNAVTLRIATVFSQIQTYLERQKLQNPKNAVLIYVSTDDEDIEALVKERVGICGKNHTCHFLSESFENLKSSYLEDTEANFSLLFQAVDSLVCSQAHRVFSGTGTSVDWYMETFHPAHLKNLDLVPNDAIPQSLRSSKDIMHHSTPERPSVNPPNENFASCLLIMDDNHFLVEWLAYHFQFMPLRRLIVAVDPNSRTSPEDILDRYSSRGLIDISIWNDSDFFSPSHEDLGKGGVFIHRLRQNQFIGACSKTLREEHWTWTMFVDTDEFIVPNPYSFPVNTIRRGNEQTLYSMLNDPRNEAIRARSACHPMTRLNIGTHESSNDLVDKDTPLGFNGSDYLTLRYRWPQTYDEVPKPGKAMVDLSRVPQEYNYSQPQNPHRPLTDICSETDVFLSIRESSFLVYHYAGTFEQFSSRVDSRNNRKWAQYKAWSFHSWSDDSARFWLEGFVKSVGAELATKLLQNHGRVL